MEKLLTCLTVHIFLAKLDENDNMIPTLSRLKSYLGEHALYYQDDFMQMELIIMQSLDWRYLFYLFIFIYRKSSI